ncbi:MFS transporter [Marmoricola endophyticus]|uniref:MFS transporter n=1 Tax=Marmoricola endophyticus TaxID=2040280 RepID=A0A917F3R5_9ACTN|nr:DHA2 family efflux MFS transporter permease subunit [Marmoricola endophyticus]GGF39805.1 MFS transporter [Marmoricola endophyticus]
MSESTLHPPATGTGTSATPSSSRLGWALVLICTAQLMVVLDSTIANIALPYIGRDLDIAQANLQWVVTGYALAFGGLLLLGGRLGDLYGRRRIFTIGLVLFAVASALGGLAQNEAMLLGARGLQGLGAALASPTALALITTTFPAGPRRNQAFSVYAAISGVGAAIGLILGGWLTGIEPAGIDGWRLTFLINVPIGIVAALLAPRFLAESESHSGELDVPGAVSATAGLMAIVFGLSRAGESQYGWGAPSTIVALAAGVVLLVAFVLIERRAEHPLLPFRILLNRTRAVAFVSMMIVPAAMFAMFFFLSLLVQNVMGYSPLQTGVAFLPFCVGMVVSATLASRLMDRVDPRFIAGTGTILAGIALYGFSRISVVDSPAGLLRLATTGGDLGSGIGYWSNIFPFVLLMSLGMGAVFVPMTLAAVHGVSHRDSGIGSGVLNTMQQVGGALGLATLATVSVHFTQDKVASLTEAIRSAAPAGGGSEPSGAAQRALGELVGQAAFTEGATHAFLTGAFMIWAASVIVWIFLGVKHEELATDEAPAGVAV